MRKPLVVVLSLLCLILYTGCGVGPVVKILKSYNDEPSRYWISFIKKNGINAINENGETMLNVAISGENVELVKACLKCKADVNITSESSKFPISLASHYYKNLDIAEMVLNAGANTHPRDDEDALKYVIEDENIDMINLFIAHKAPMDYSAAQSRVISSVTPYEVLKALINGGFKPSIYDLTMIIPQFVETKDDAAAADYSAWIADFAKNPAYKDAQVSDRETLLSSLYGKIYSTPVEVERAMYAITQLIDNGHTAYVDNATSPIAFIGSSRVSENAPQIIAYFMEHGLELNTLSRGRYNKSTALHEVILNTGGKEYYENAVALYNYLISIGADPSIRDEQDNTATKLFEGEQNVNTQHYESIRREIDDYKQGYKDKPTDDILKWFDNQEFVKSAYETQLAALKEILHDRGVAGY